MNLHMRFSLSGLGQSYMDFLKAPLLDELRRDGSGLVRRVTKRDPRTGRVEDLAADPHPTGERT